MSGDFYRQLPLFCLILICLINIRRIHIDSDSCNRKYNRLTPEEQSLYDVKKVNHMGVLWYGSILLITVLLFFFDLLFAHINFVNIFSLIYLLDIIIGFLIFNTKWGLNLFCKRRT